MRASGHTVPFYDSLDFSAEWRLEEQEKIDRSLSGAERKAALCQLLDQETQLIGSIGRHKQDADAENRYKSVQGFLDKVNRLPDKSANIPYHEFIYQFLMYISSLRAWL